MKPVTLPQTPFMVPERVDSGHFDWNSDRFIKDGYFLIDAGVVVTEVTEDRVIGYRFVPGNATFNVKRKPTGFKLPGGCSVSYKWADIGQELDQTHFPFPSTMQIPGIDIFGVKQFVEFHALTPSQQWAADEIRAGRNGHCNW